MENQETYMPQLKVLISSGCPDNVELAYHIACGMNLQEELMQPWRELWAVYSEQEADDVRILTELCQLEKIELVEKDLEEFPQALLMMPNLEIIDLSGNYIEELPEALFSMNNLLRLDLSGNLLESVPEMLFQMQSLLCLDLSDNFLEEAPESIGKIRALNLAGNDFVTAQHPFLRNNNAENDIVGFYLDLTGLGWDGIWALDILLPEIPFCMSYYYCICGPSCEIVYLPIDPFCEFSSYLQEDSHRNSGSFRRFYYSGIDLNELYEEIYNEDICNY